MYLFGSYIEAYEIMTFCSRHWNSKQRLLQQLTLTGRLSVSIVFNSLRSESVYYY